MKFSEMTYTRPDAESTKQHLAALTEQLKAAKSYEEARKVFLAQQEQAKHISTASTLASVRHSIARATPSTMRRKSSGTASSPSWRSTIRRGRRQCSKARSVRNSPGSSAI